MQVTAPGRDQLRRLAELRLDRPLVLSLYLDLDPSRFAIFFGHRGDDNDQNDLALVLTERAMVAGPGSLVLLSLGLVAMALVRRWRTGN